MLLRNTFFNLVGLGAPLLVAVFAIPVLVSGLGDASFGLLTLIWAVVSYFGLFDLGLGRALTHRLAQTLGRGERELAGTLTWTALGLMAGLGLLAGALLYWLADWGISLIREVPDRDEARGAVQAMAFAMPFIVLTTGLRGVLEATHAFGVINAIRLPMGVFTFLGPLAVLALGEAGLDAIAWVLAAGRAVACAAHWVFVRRFLEEMGTPRLAFDRREIRPLAESAGWLTLSNTISPLMNYVDRFVIGATVSAGAVAHYATPHEMVTKLWILPGALTAVLFPSFSAQLANQDAAARATYRNSLLALGAILLPVVVALTIWAKPLLSLWIGPEFAEHSAPVLQIMSWGMLATCLATIPYTTIQSAGKARLTALLHLFEFPVFVLVLMVLVGHWGLAGAALAWSLRNIVDALLLLHFARPIMRGLGVAPGPATR